MTTLQYKFNKNDEYYTPKNAVYPIMESIKPNSIIWCPFDKEESNFVRVFKENNFTVIYSHIENGEDFFKKIPPECDYIISNPPYSKKTEIFEKLFEIGKPFAMLINFQGIFDHRKRFENFQKNRIELLVLSPRVNYLSMEKEQLKGVPFQSVYCCYKIFKEQINYKYLKENKKGGE